MKGFESLSIVCPTAGYPDLIKSLKTYRKYAPGAQVIVVDQMPEPSLSSKEIVELTDIYVWVYRTLGFSKAMNMGIEIADRDSVCCMNDDVELINVKWFAPIASRFDIDYTTAGINVSSIKGYREESDNLPCNCYVELMEASNNCPQCRSYKEEYTEEDWEYLNTERHLKSSPINPVRPNITIDGVMVWCTVFRSSSLEMIKDNDCYFDEHFYPGGGEDYDMMCRMYDLKHTVPEDEIPPPYRVVGIYNTWAYHHWFGTRIKNPPVLVPHLRWNKLDQTEGSKWGKNWDLWGRKDKSIPTPPCTKVKL